MVNSSLFSLSWSYWKCVDSKRKKKERGGRLLRSQARRFQRRLSPSNGEALGGGGGVRPLMSVISEVTGHLF